MAETNNNFAATITKASGKVSVIREGKYITLNEGDKVYATDTIETNDASVELTFADGAISMLSPKTTMTVEEFSFSETEPSFVLNLAAGAMRSISGEVVEQNPDAFKVVTPKATVGIRGTDWVLTINPDGSQTVAVLSLSQGHNVSVTGNNGQIVSLSTANQGATIGADADGTVTPYTFTPQEVQELVQQITGALGLSADDNQDNNEAGEGEGEDDTDGSNSESTSEVVLELDAALVAALSDVGLAILEDALADVGVEVSLGEDLTNNSDFSTIDDSEDIGEGTEDAGDGLVGVTTDGTESYEADAGTIQGSIVTTRSITPQDPDAPVHNMVSHRVTITGNIDSSDVAISADIGELIGNATVHAGNDEIIAQNISAGTIVGDAVTYTDGTLYCGNDTISVNNMSGGAIHGDVSFAGGDVIQYGNDTIRVNGTMSDGRVNGNGGDDYISVATLNGSSAFVNGDAGDDYIHVSTLTDGTIDGGDGKNNIFITNMGGGTVSPGAGGSNSVAISGTMSDGSVNFGSGGGSVYVGTLDGGSIGSESSNALEITVGSFKEGSINGSEGDDSITLNSFDATTAITINGGEGSDVLQVKGTFISGKRLDLESIEEANFGAITGGSIYGGDTAQSITAASLSGGSISGGDAGDTITVGVMSGPATGAARIYAGTGADVITATVNNTTAPSSSDSEGVIFYLGGHVSSDPTADGANDVLNLSVASGSHHASIYNFVEGDVINFGGESYDRARIDGFLDPDGNGIIDHDSCTLTDTRTGAEITLYFWTS